MCALLLLYDITPPQVWGTRLRPRLAHRSATPTSPWGERGRRGTHDQSQHAAAAGLVHPASSYGDPEGLLTVLVVQETLRAGGGGVFPQVPVCVLRDQVPARSPRRRLRCGCCCERRGVDRQETHKEIEKLLGKHLHLLLWRAEVDGLIREISDTIGHETIGHEVHCAPVHSNGDRCTRRVWGWNFTVVRRIFYRKAGFSWQPASNEHNRDGTDIHWRRQHSSVDGVELAFKFVPLIMDVVCSWVRGCLVTFDLAFWPFVWCGGDCCVRQTREHMGVHRLPARIDISIDALLSCASVRCHRNP